MSQTDPKRKPGFFKTVHSALPYLFHIRTIVISSAIILVLAASILLSFLFHGSNSSFISYHWNTEIINFQNQLHVFSNDIPVADPINAESVHLQRSNLDGSVCVFTTDTKELYLVNGQKLKKIADDVHHFEISTSGNAIAYAKKYVDQYALNLYNVSERVNRELTDNLSKLDFALSPDGETVAYYTEADVLMCYRDKKNSVITDMPSDLVGLSDEGKHIYAICSKTRSSNAMYSFNLRGSIKELGPVSSLSVKFNHDHRQIMFYNNGETYISSNGKEAQLASSYPLYLVTAPNSQGASEGTSITYPVETLFDHVYTCSDGESTGAWLIKKDPTDNIKLVSKVSVCTLDASGKYLYYIHNGQQLRCIRIADGVKAADNSHLIAEDADFYVLTPNRKRLYFTTGEQLMCTNGKSGGKVKVIADNKTDPYLSMSASGIVYFSIDHQLFFCKNGKSGVPFSDNVYNAYQSSNGVVYIITADSIYTAYSKKQPEKMI